MIRFHPYQNVYFNGLLGDMKAVSEKFDLDYWGLSYRQAYEYILEHDARALIKVSVGNWPGVANSYLLRRQDKKRIRLVFDPRQADYMIDNHRYSRNKNDVLALFKWHSIMIKGAQLVTIYKIPEESL